ncbi:EscR/YscR/HrcR family type III secretion system export apparatus protein (plasmid) [Enterobacteriaceae bacterium Kacie_13]|nr:EscR/YscR/HrcR family type III secretion system export apparatus protein [Enterobacteriaceae bacterium Kacie_13]
MDALSKLGEQPLSLIVLLFVLSLLPLLIVIGTSFLKISIVLSLLRNALGIQQIPPNMAIYGLSLILSIYIMAPLAYNAKEALENEKLTLDNPALYEKLDASTLEPYKQFLLKHTEPRQVMFFSKTTTRLWPEKVRQAIPENSLFVLVPAFTVSQLTEAFKIGLLLYLPFIAIDLVVSNVLLAMGMMMVSPVTISLPFKILLFVVIGGWERLLTQLILSYQ